MSLASPAGWLDRVAESLCDHEDRRSSLQNLPPRYEVLAEISRGGMGIIYRAWDPQLGRDVALKVLRTEEGNLAEVHERFAREARLAAGLHHAHIVPIYDTGTWNGQHYIAMQLIEGTTLDQARPDARAALAAIRDAARGLHYAHEQGIVHRDVKPSNLLLDGHGHVYVADFGVARHALVAANLTSPGTVVGTPAYMSPEQAMGLEAGPRSDVYSLGATLYELLTGRPPYTGADPVEVVEAVRSRDPLPPRSIVPDLSKNMEAIILGAMERSCEERYASAAALADDIELYLKGERPVRRPRGMTYRFQRAFVRHPWRSTATIVFCLLLLLAGTAAGYWIHGYVNLRRGRAATTDAGKKKCFEIAKTFFSEADRELARIAQEEKDGDLRTANDLAARKLRVQKEKADSDAAEEKDKNQKQLAEARAALQKVEDDSKRRSEAIQKIAAAVLQRIKDKDFKDARTLAGDLQERDSVRFDDLNARIREAEFDEGVKGLGQLASKADSELFAKRFAELSDSSYESQRDRNARLAQPAFQLARKLPPKDALPWFDAAERLGIREGALYEQRGLARLATGDLDAAQKDLDQFRSHSAIGVPPSPRFADLPYARARQAISANKWAEAIPLLDEAIGLDGRHARAWHDRGLARWHAHSLAKEAIRQDLKRGLDLDPALVPDAGYRDAGLAFARRQVDQNLRAQDSPSRAAAWLDTVETLTILLDRMKGDLAPLWIERGRMYRRLGEVDKAAQDARRAGDSAAAQDARRAGDSAAAHLLAGQIHYERAHAGGRDAAGLKSALEEFERALALDPKEAVSLYWIATCRHLLNEPAEAEKIFRKAVEAGLSSPDLHYQLALVHAAQKNAPAAIVEATLAIQQVKSMTEDDYVSGLFERRGLPFSEAVVLLERDACLSRARAQHESSRYTECVEDCSRALLLDPKFFDALMWRGDARFRLKQFREARGDFEEAVRQARKDADRKSAEEWRQACDRSLRD